MLSQMFSHYVCSYSTRKTTGELLTDLLSDAVTPSLLSDDVTGCLECVPTTNLNRLCLR
jgi:hypothetical protein